MIAQTIIDDARRELIENTASFWSDAELLRHLNRAELDFVNKTRILEDTAQLSLIQGRLDYPLPANWLSARAIFHRTTNDDGSFSWKRVYPSNLEKQAQQNRNFLDTSEGGQGMPKRYWIWGRSLWLDRAPDLDNASALYLFYKSKPTALTNANESINIDSSLSEALLSYILWKAWLKEEEFSRADDHRTTYDRYIAEGRRWVKKQSGDQRYRLDIDSPYPIDGASDPSNPLSF